MDYKLTFEDGSEGYLMHYGVKGMQWGVVTQPKVLNAQKNKTAKSSLSLADAMKAIKKQQKKAAAKKKKRKKRGNPLKDATFTRVGSGSTTFAMRRERKAALANKTGYSKGKKQDDQKAKLKAYEEQDWVKRALSISKAKGK